MLEEMLFYLQKQGWEIQQNTSQTGGVPQVIVDRYPRCPEVWKQFLAQVESAVSKDERNWFLCAEDYDERLDHAWQWNEWEQLSLKAAEGDPKWQAAICAFWNNHLPIVLSLRNGYAYYAIAIEDGSVVYGSEPEFEECTAVAESFEAFMGKICQGEIAL